MKPNYNRVIILDTETTGMNQDGPPHEGHRIIEIGAVEMINRKLTGRHFHVYIKPDRLIEPDAIKVHGITDEFLEDKPTYEQIHQEFYEFIRHSELIAHNASFDVGFINHEFSLLDPSTHSNIETVEQICQITDTLAMAKKIFPGKRNNLDVLCERYGIDNSHRTLHGALLDSEILADVYLMMTGGQTSLSLNDASDYSEDGQFNSGIRRVNPNRKALKIIQASADELQAHEKKLAMIAKKGSCLWQEESKE